MSEEKCTSKIPCGKFIVAVVVSLTTLGFAGGMLISGGASAALAPFYTGLIGSSITYWLTPPTVSGK